MPVMPVCGFFLKQVKKFTIILITEKFKVFAQTPRLEPRTLLEHSLRKALHTILALAM
jgi:hypothetical protein